MDTLLSFRRASPILSGSRDAQGRSLHSGHVRFSLELAEKTHVILIQHPHIVDIKPLHNDTLQTDTKGKAAVYFRIDPAVLQHPGMHHPAPRISIQPSPLQRLHPLP